MSLHPFFSYFGSKYRLAKEYPLPVCKILIEPFAGAAGYSLLHNTLNVKLYDSYEPVIELWKYLIEVTSDEILGLPLEYDGRQFSKDNPVSQCNIAQEAKILIGFWLTESQTYSSLYPLSKSRGGNWTARKRAMIAAQVENIRHWTAECKDYQQIDIDEKCTWFIDPPYSQAGKRYKQNNINYTQLAQWCKERGGQTIVCEQLGASWLDFRTLKKHSNGSNNKYEEVIWTNDCSSCQSNESTNNFATIPNTVK